MSAVASSAKDAAMGLSRLWRRIARVAPCDGSHLVALLVNAVFDVYEYVDEYAGAYHDAYADEWAGAPLFGYRRAYPCGCHCAHGDA